MVMEGFEDGALVLRLEDRHLIELNPTAHYILTQTDGKRDAAQVAALVAETFQIPQAEALQDAVDLYAQLSEQKVVEIIEPDQADKEKNVGETTTVSPRYLRNPDVVLREEDPDEGGLLFNPDTNQVKVLNTTGLFIWQHCDERDVDGIAAEMLKAFEDAPQDEIARDVREFIDDMVATGFIGTVEKLG